MSIRLNITLSLMIISGFAAAAILILLISWKTHESVLVRIDISSKQLDIYSELLSHSQHLEADILNIARFYKIDRKRVSRTLKMIDDYIDKAKKITDVEQKWLEGSPEQAAEKIEIGSLETLSRLQSDMKIILDKIAISVENNQTESIENLTRYFKANLLSRFIENIRRSIIDGKGEIVSQNKKISKYSLYLQITGLIVGILFISYIFGYNIYSATSNITKEHLIQQHKLEEIVNSRTSKLTEANEKLKQVDIMRGQFLADISHEIRTPITAIRGETEIRLRKSGHVEAEYRDTLSRVKLLSDQISVLIDDLLFVARSEKDAIHFEFKMNEIDGIIVSVVNSHRVIAKQKKIEFEIEWPNESIELFMDIFRIKQALNIIIDNALKYSFDENIITISITDEQNFVNISVKNKGEQIAEEEIPYLFERFYRGNNNMKNGGSGLGLPIAKWIIERHDGSINLETNGHGVTVVTMKLPNRNLIEAHH